MYYMIHVTDHVEAPQLMARAYRNALEPEESPEQLELWLAHWSQWRGRTEQCG